MTGPQSYREAGCCEWTRARLADASRPLPAREQRQLRRHIAGCAECAEFSPETQKLRAALQSIPHRAPAPDLNLRLRVIASREASQRKLGGGRLQTWRRRIQRWSDELMRPFAIPTAGGFASAMLLFSVLAPSLAMRAQSAGVADIPTGLYTEASVKSSLPFGYDGQDVLVEVYVDGSGRMVEYNIPYAHASAPEVRRNIENHLLTMVFNPATTFGQPISAKLLVWFRTSRIEVRG
jgi:hypothetical protein